MWGQGMNERQLGRDVREKGEGQVKKDSGKQ